MAEEKEYAMTEEKEYKITRLNTGPNHTCPIEYTLDVIGGKWKLMILYYLMTEKIQRYGELKRSINSITHKMLSAQLKELEKAGIVDRKEYPQIPPKVEYSLTEKGATLLPILGMMQDWGTENMSRERGE